MDIASCGMCGKTVTAKDLETGRAVLLLRKVWCEACQVKMVARESEKRVAKGKRGPYSGHRITTVRPPSNSLSV